MPSNPTTVLDTINALRDPMGRPISIVARVERTYIVLCEICLSKLSGLGAVDVIEQICAAGDSAYVRLVAEPAFAQSLEQEWGIDLTDHDFASFDSDGRQHRLARALEEGTLVYVAETGPGPFMALGAQQYGQEIGNFVSLTNEEFHSLVVTERGLRRLAPDWMSCCNKFKAMAINQSEPVDLHLIADRKFKRYRFLRNEGVALEAACEATFSHVIAMAGMLDDRVANLAAKLQSLSSNQVWPGIQLDIGGKSGGTPMKDRRNARLNLYRAFGNGKDLERLQEIRNNLLHAMYYYAFCELDGDNVLFSPTFQLKEVTPARPTVTSQVEIARCVKILLNSYLDWFLRESARQISLT